jgi:hypothetical protein
MKLQKVYQLSWPGDFTQLSGHNETAHHFACEKRFILRYQIFKESELLC